MCYLFSFLCVWHISINKLSEVWIFSQYLKHDRYPVDFRVLKVLLEPFVLHPRRLSPFHGRVIISRSLSIQLLGSGGGLFLYLSHIWDVDSWLLLYFLQNISEKGCTGDKIFEIFFRSGNSLLVTSSHLLLGKIDDRRWDGWMASKTQWTWVWANSKRWWRAGKPGMLQFMWSERLRHDLLTEQQATATSLIGHLTESKFLGWK